jgi:hypothetical protein
MNPWMALTSPIPVGEAAARYLILQGTVRCNRERLEAEHRPGTGRCLAIRTRKGSGTQSHLGAMEGTMATTREHNQIVETPTEARQAEPGPSVLALLTVSTGLAVLILGVIWFVFFRV